LGPVEWFLIIPLEAWTEVAAALYQKNTPEHLLGNPSIPKQIKMKMGEKRCNTPKMAEMQAKAWVAEGRNKYLNREGDPAKNITKEHALFYTKYGQLFEK